jgi:type I restriction enzyme S subunit
MSEELPKDWKWVKLGEVLTVSSGKGIKVNSLQGGRYSVYGGNGLNGYHSEYFIEEPKLIIGRVGVKCGVTHVTKPKSWVTDNALIVEPKHDAFDIQFLKLKLGFENLNKLSVSTAQPVISGSKIYAYEIILPPKPIQQAIVSKIEELFSELDKGIENLHTAQQQLKTYRQSVLKWAFEGKLTNSLNCDLYDLPDEHDLNIAAEPETEYKVEGNHNNQTNQNNQSSDKGELPKGWKIVKIEDATISLDNKRKPINKEERKKRVGNIPYYGANGQVGWIDDYIFNEPLVCVVEDETFTGREIPFSYKITGKTWVNNHAHVLKPKDDLNIDFLNYQLYYYPFLRLTTGTTGRKKLTKNALMNAPIKVCSLGEQNKIVQAIESRLSVADKMEESITQSLQQAEALKQSILKKAFEGRLV